MAWKRGERIPTNLIVGFLGSGKTTSISNLIDRRPSGEKWSIFINEYGMVSIDQALIDSESKEVAVEELGGGCACCTMSYAFEPLLAQFIRRTKPDRLIVEPSGASHPSKITDVLRGPNFANAIDLRNTICLVDPKDFEDTRWRNTEVFHDQIQLADIVVVNWTDKREKDLIHRCRDWIESFDPPKQFVFETSFGQIDPEWLDIESPRVRFPSFPDAHPKPISSGMAQLNVLSRIEEGTTEPNPESSTSVRPTPGNPIRFQNKDLGHEACGWVFHVDDIFRRDQLLDLLGHLHPIVRLKGIFRCQDNWWSINRAKDTTSYIQSSYRRDSRLEIILDRNTDGWDEFERNLLACLASKLPA